jgi:ABC-type iron transport system FetAB ATPase subunit
MKEELLQTYQINVEYPDVSGFEHLETLQIRDQLALIETELSETEKQQLSLADQLLIKNAQVFYAELSTVIDLKKKRESENISPVSWWWYMDVLANLPQLFSSFEYVSK